PPPRGVLRGPLPSRAPDRGGRGQARRRELRLRRRVGVAGARRPAGAPQGTARVRVRRSHPEELQVVETSLNLTLKVWRQDGPSTEGRFETYVATGISPDMSFLEMLDTVNEQLIEEGKLPIEFDHDCREGICGSCGIMIDGKA